MHWIYLICAIVLEVIATSCMKLSNGFTRPLPSVLLFFFYAGCFACLTVAIKKIDVSVAYAVWSGVGIALISAIAVIFFKEPISTQRIIGLLAVTFGIVLLTLSEQRPAKPATESAIAHANSNQSTPER